MAFGGKALEGDLENANPAALPLMRYNLQAYAQTHGYGFDPNAHRFYDVVVQAVDPNTGEGSYKVYLPLSWGPAAVPGQASSPPAPASSAAPAPAASVGTASSAAPAASAAVPASAATAG